MIVIVGLVVLLVAVTAGFTGVITDAGPAHPLTENFERRARRCTPHRWLWARRSPRTRQIPTRGGVAESTTRLVARPSGRLRSHSVCGEPTHRQPQHHFPTRPGGAVDTHDAPRVPPSLQRALTHYLTRVADSTIKRSGATRFAFRSTSRPISRSRHGYQQD